ncbi:vWA domain-containing protein [Xanthovirga aplysinae]|uniref:vWA domain-containing protein n=1 Tax=Xanthovirga aplysinae TaxID=2529853 RepID=UPI0012BB5AE9|nr:VWA domain-containing protein [Xanthovirga aplysinae]MTI32711.1 VWA domain-containing protein [Xanthovirga aplysinae]
MLESTGDGLSWLSLKWFFPSTFQNYSWENPNWLYLLWLIPLFFIVRWLIGLRFNQTYDVALEQKHLKINRTALLRFVPEVIMALSIALITIALARPQKNNEEVEQWTEGIDIMLVLDISTSMEIEDFKPNRLEAAKTVAHEFISGRFQDRIGMVVFSGEAFSLSPLTTDYDLLYNYIDEIDFNMIDKGGTAIGSALAVATNRMRDSDSKSKVMILMSDGDNNMGNIDPLTAAKLAHAYGIRIYTIGIGKEGRVPFGKTFFGTTRYVENTLDETTLREIAKIGEGRFFRVSNNQALQEVFASIDKMEKAEIKETRFKDTTDFYTAYLHWAVVLFLFWLLLKSSFINNLLQD